MGCTSGRRNKTGAKLAGWARVSPPPLNHAVPRFTLGFPDRDKEPEMKRATVFLALLLAAGGCFHDSTAPIPATMHGRWVLKTMDGSPVPGVYTEVTNFKLEIVGGTLVLHEDNTFADSTDLRRTEFQIAHRVIDVATGAWQQVGDTIKLNSTRGEHYFMVFTDRTLKQDLGGRILLYRR